jgi:hypothetical protein
MEKKLLVAILCIANCAIGCAYLSPLRNRPVWDLPQFYFAGRLVRSGNAAAMYDTSAYTGLVEELRNVDERASKQSIYFNRPAFEALLFVPLAYLSFTTAKIIVLIWNVLLLALLVWKMPQWLHAPAWVRICLFIFMPFLYSVAFGQDTLLLTLIVSFGLFLLLRKQDTLAGVVLALGMFKPHLIWAMPIALLAAKRWKATCGFVVTGSVLALISLALVGPRGVTQWLGLLQASTTDNAPMLMGNVRALGLHYGFIASLVATVTALVCFLTVLKRNSLEDQFMAAILIGLLLSPHTYRQDYALMAVVALRPLHPLARSLILIPWPYFLLTDNMVGFILLAVACLAGLASRTWHSGTPSMGRQIASCKQT